MPDSIPTSAASTTSRAFSVARSISGIPATWPARANRSRGWRATYSWAFDEKIVKPFVPEKDFYATDDFTDWALEWLDEERGEDEPFFLYLAYNAPHWPLHAHAKDIAKYEGVYETGYEAIRKARYERQLEMRLFNAESAPLSPPDHNPWDSFPEEKKKEEALRMQIHAAMVDNVDQNIGRLIAKLKDQDAFENTLILFWSTTAPATSGLAVGRKIQGGMGNRRVLRGDRPILANAVNSPLRKWKVQGLEGGINTPMVAHWPNGISVEPGSICRDACHLIDLLPTFMELAGDGAEYPDGIPSIDGSAWRQPSVAKISNGENRCFSNTAAGK